MTIKSQMNILYMILNEYLQSRKIGHRIDYNLLVEAKVDNVNDVRYG